MGLGSFGGGAGAARFLCRAGARVTVTDLRSEEELGAGLAELRDLPVRLVLGEHRDEDFRAADLVVANPAVPPDEARLVLAREAGARVVSAVQLFLERTRARVAGITGTQGKSSATSMTAQLLERAGLRPRLGGNIGGSLLPEIEAIGEDEVAVLELSSYQLEALRDDGDLAGRAAVVGITNVLADHLERHGTPEAYARAKARVLELVDEGGTAFVPASAPLGPLTDPAALGSCRGRIVRFGPGAELRIEDGRFRLGDEELGRVADLRLPGGFQAANALLALGLARALGAEPERLAAAVPELVGLPHRLEDLGVVRGRRVWDNGVSTTPDSTVAALEALDTRCVLLCGGKAKRGLPLAPLVRAALDRVELAIAFGGAGPELAAALREGGVPVRVAGTLGEALEATFEDPGREAPVLFSPACASFDAYPNFLARAREFRAAIDALR
jgi:UDP-N-acetylmuramoylalanine--D-glutamate ligase